MIYTTREAEIKAKTDLIASGAIALSRLAGTRLEFFVGETHTFTLTTDDYTSKTLALIFETTAGVDVATVADGSLTTTSSSVAFAIPAAVTASVTRMRWALRDTAGGDEVLRFGTVVVSAAAESD